MPSGLELRFLRRLVHEREKLSRNRNPAAFDTPRARRLTREAARLRGVIHALVHRTDADLQVGTHPESGEVLLKLQAHDGSWTQRTRLDSVQWAVVRENDVARARLDAAAPCAFDDADGDDRIEHRRCDDEGAD